MADVRVDAAVGEQTHQMQRSTRPRSLPGRACRGSDSRKNVTILDRQVDARDRLVDDEACAQVEMADLRVPHLSAPADQHRTPHVSASCAG